MNSETEAILEHIEKRINRKEAAMENVHRSSEEHTRLCSQHTALISLRELIQTNFTDRNKFE